jgi:hypothetical protein
LETDNGGKLWLRKQLSVGTIETSRVEIGYLDDKRENTEIHEVIHAGEGEQKFIVYEDGKMYAEGAEFHGTIYASGGKIGNMTITEVEDSINSTKKLDI